MKLLFTTLFALLVIIHGSQAQTVWFAQNSGISTYLQEVSFTDANNGTAVGPFGTILRTINGGTTWTQQSSGSATIDLRSVSFTDTNNGTVVGASGTILRTTNGGTTWIPQASGTSSYLWDVDFTDANIGTAVGNNGTILRTTNGGTNWTQQSSGTTLALFGVSFTDATTGTVVGDNGTILRTTNGGATWTPQTSGTTFGLFRVSFTDANNGTAIGGNSTILRTTNGGASWTPQISGTTERLIDIDFTDVNNGTIVGDFGTILRTTDGGSNWVPQASGTTRDLFGVSFNSTNTGTVVGGQGTILRTSGPASCNPPAGISFSSATSTSVTASWTAPGGITNFEFVIDQASSSPSGAGISVSGDTTPISSLTPGTTYYLHIRSDCGGGNFSNWVTFSFSTPATTGVRDNLAQSNLISVYPNPVTEKVIIHKAITSPGRLTLVDITGRITLEKWLTDETTTIDLTDLVEGIYLVHYFTGDKSGVQILQKR